jgi:molybdenum cofactor biosynthesis enzyme MoaA
MEQAKLTINDVENASINLKQITFEVTDACNLRCKYYIITCKMHLT